METTPVGTDALTHPGHRRAPARLVAVVLLALALLAAACGGDETVDAGAGGDTPTEDPTGDEPDRNDDPADGQDDPGDPGDGPEAEWQLTEARPDLISPQPAPISELERLDDRTIAVRYQNGSEPCSLADVTVEETPDTVEVALVTGLHPEAATMTCIALLVNYEIQVTLDEPLGDRELVALSP